MSLEMRFINLNTKEEIFHTNQLKEFTSEQLCVLVQQIVYELKGRKEAPE